MKEEQSLEFGPKISSQLESLLSEKKFVEDFSLGYPGAPSEEIRIQAESIINKLINRLISASNKRANVGFLWQKMESASRELSELDSEELDRGFSYFESIMDIYSIESSEGRLNEWRYGF